MNFYIKKREPSSYAFLLLCCVFPLFIFILLLLIIVARDKVCGIPLFNWCSVLVSICIIRVLAIILRSIYGYIIDFILSFLIEGFTLGWLIYGNIIFYSKLNDCEGNENTLRLYRFTFFLIMIGYLYMFATPFMLVNGVKELREECADEKLSYC